MMQKEKSQKLLFVLGILPRSGTHFLANLIAQHSDCVHSIIPEDFILEKSNNLKKNIGKLTGNWKDQLKLEEPEYSILNKILYNSIGNSFKDFLFETKENAAILKKKNKEDSNINSIENKYLITKTPSVVNIKNFLDFFPNEKVLVIVRDGRMLVESYVNSFSKNREEAIREWAAGARSIKEFNIEAHSKSVSLIKYEELHLNTEVKLKEILSFLELDVSRINLETALNLPVFGSSTFKRGKGEVHWWPVQKTTDFKPLENSANWPRKYHERFNWLTKEEMEFLGYTLTQFTSNKAYWMMYNYSLDFKWTLMLKIKNTRKLLIHIYQIVFNK
jgi:protein-tyrosine sulfotransferase